MPGSTGIMDVVIRILNENAEQIEEITDLDIANFEGYEPPTAYKYMIEIYNKARSQAMGVEKVINDILLQLGGEDDAQGEDNTIPF